MTAEKRTPSFFDHRAARILTIGLGTGLSYAIWAAFSNWEYGFSIAGRAALVQGVTFGISATCSASLMELLFRVSNNLVIRCLTSSVGSGIIVFFGFLTMHLINGTPNIVKTMLPPILLATPYYALYPVELARREMINNPDGMIINSEFLRAVMTKLAKKHTQNDAA